MNLIFDEPEKLRIAIQVYIIYHLILLLRITYVNHG